MGVIVIGVALMMMVLFFVMIAVEQTFVWVDHQLSKCFGSKKANDPEDPAQAAALVGSFKRYKN